MERGRWGCLQSIWFVGFCVLVSIAYGIAHDMVTAHVDVTYFTVHHPYVVASQSPVVMALVWGFLATWRVGLFAGCTLWMANCFALHPSLTSAEMRKAFVVSTCALWVSAMVVLGGCYWFNGDLPEDRRRFSAVQMTHTWSYGAGAFLTLIVALWIVWTRMRREAATS